MSRGLGDDHHEAELARALALARRDLRDADSDLDAAEDRADRLGSVLCAMAFEAGRRGNMRYAMVGLPDIVQAPVIWLFPSDEVAP